MNWYGAWSFAKGIPKTVWAGTIWALCVLGWWLTRSQLIKEKAKNIRLEHRARNDAARKGAEARLLARKVKIQDALTHVQEQTEERDVQIESLGTSELTKELNSEFLAP